MMWYEDIELICIISLHRLAEVDLRLDWDKGEVGEF